MNFLTRWRQRRIARKIRRLVREELKLEAEYAELDNQLRRARDYPAHYLDRLIDIRGRMVQVRHDIDTLKTQLKETHDQ